MRYLFSCLATIALALAAYSPSGWADSAMTAGIDKLTIISPHRKSIQQEFIPKFEKHYEETYRTKVTIEWLDQGGASDDLRFILSRFEKTPTTSGIDIFWGGGEHPHYELDRKQLLQSYKISAALRPHVPEELAGLKLYNKEETWHAAAMSSFGIFYNRMLYKMLKLDEPKSWEDLATPRLVGNLSNADPRRSSSNVTMNLVILQAYGWEKGWELLTAIAGNTRSYTHSSSDPIKAIVSGDAAAGLTIDYFANAKIGDIGASKLGFVLPAQKTIVNPDPIAILKGAPNLKVAERFVEFVLSAPAQKILLLPKGASEGPLHATPGRMAVNAQAYRETEGRRVNQLNPFALNFSPMMLDVNKVTALQFIFTDLLGATHIDTHKQLVDAWKAIIKRGSKPEELAVLAAPPVSEAQMQELAKQWSNNAVRNKTINEWVTFAKEKYAKLAKAGL